MTASVPAGSEQADGLTAAERLELLNGDRVGGETERDRIARVAGRIAADRAAATRERIALAIEALSRPPSADIPTYETMRLMALRITRAAQADPAGSEHTDGLETVIAAGLCEGGPGQDECINWDSEVPGGCSVCRETAVHVADQVRAHLAATLTAARAEAWDEGWTYRDECDPNGAVLTQRDAAGDDEINPYRASPCGAHSWADGECTACGLGFDPARADRIAPTTPPNNTTPTASASASPTASETDKQS